MDIFIIEIIGISIGGLIFLLFLIICFIKYCHRQVINQPRYNQAIIIDYSSNSNNYPPSYPSMQSTQVYQIKEYGYRINSPEPSAPPYKPEPSAPPYI